jgi:hypothetical protein
MANGTELAITQAARLNEIGFPEFTAKLITDTFDALVAANIRQTEAYIELVQQVSKTLTQYINDTRDDISGEELMQFLAAALPPDDADAESDPTKVAVNGTITTTDRTNLNTALAIPGHPAEGDIAADNQVNVPTDTALSESHVQTILQAVANRLAANKYDLLKEMVKLGILRLVVENGTIETRLTFTTYGSTFYQKQATQYHRDSFQFKSKARTGWFVSLWAKASASTRYSSVNVSTTRETNRDISGSRVQIYGSVIINFKTDYQPLTA